MSMSTLIELSSGASKVIISNELRYCDNKLTPYRLDPEEWFFFLINSLFIIPLYDYCGGNKIYQHFYFFKRVTPFFESKQNNSVFLNQSKITHWRQKIMHVKYVFISI